MDSQGMGARHPDAMKLDKGLTPLLLAACIRVPDEERDRRLKLIMGLLLGRGACISQREELTGVTIMHLLAGQPSNCCVIHRIRFLLKLLEDYRSGPDIRSSTAFAGLRFDPVLNDAPAAGAGGDIVGTAVHLLGMRCYQGMLPQDMCPRTAADRRGMLQRQRRMLPPGLQDAGHGEAAAAFN